MAEKEQSIALSKEQMEHLIGLGVDASCASMVYSPISSRSPYFILKAKSGKFTKEFWNEERRAIAGEDIYERLHGRDVPAFTTQDILNLMPPQILIGEMVCSLIILKKMSGNSLVTYAVTDENGLDSLREDNVWEEPTLIQALYNGLLWLIENDYYVLDKSETSGDDTNQTN